LKRRGSKAWKMRRDTLNVPCTHTTNTDVQMIFLRRECRTGRKRLKYPGEHLIKCCLWNTVWQYAGCGGKCALLNAR